ncbi:hypothetical protein J31TS4_06880 [Paenibacillus sp. J31TS4]|uniref:GerMN domain-containing protein n=1 Tax=Paenibacillus sp. J31TS4 TaxID=2807195 RepID=UPI001B1047D3|nr:GerMN domain-containing protein [Paenibacillus sp. J31TS4]GIP37408.1 hypothetical protein J31TS4_06880 [Paenibacillus sp. J31TS4]
MRKLSIVLVTVSAAAVLSLTACGQKEQPIGQASPVTSPSGNQANGSGGAVSPSPTANAQKTMQIKSYYGDESGEKLVEKASEIKYTTDSSKYLAALATLKSSPDPKLGALLSGFTFTSAKIDEGNLVVDLKIDPSGRWGAQGELLTLDALKKTLFQFSEVKTLDILLEGKQEESLMGHVSFPHPIKRN